VPLQLIARFVGIMVEGALATPRFSNLWVSLAFKQSKCDCYYRDIILSSNSHHSSLRSFHVMAGSAVLTLIPICHEAEPMFLKKVLQ
jgi:hypothetical protein